MERSYEEIELGYVQAMGLELGLLYSRLLAECTSLHLTWGEYAVLFGNEEAVDLLDRSASTFAGMIQVALSENVLLHLCRFIDKDSKKKGGGEERKLSIHQITHLISSALKPQVKQAIDELVEKSRFAIDWRNRHIAHRDLDLSMGKSAKPLTSASKLQVEEALQGLCKVLNLVEKDYTGSTTLWGKVGPMCGGALLLDVLKDGLKAGVARKERLLIGRPLPDDFD